MVQVNTPTSVHKGNAQMYYFHVHAIELCFAQTAQDPFIKNTTLNRLLIYGFNLNFT